MRIVLRLLVVLLLIALLGWFGGRAYLARSVAQQDGTMATGGVHGPIEITFDAKGVPQVWAKTDADAYFAIGWLHASDRLFQMELVRRLSRGELSEVFGEAAYETDVHQRRIGFARRANAAALTPRAREASQRYIDGVNAYIARASVLPPEFVLLRLKPRPWTLEDCLAVSGYQTWFSHELMDQDQKYQQLTAKLGLPAHALENAGHPWSPPTVSGRGAQGAGGSESGGIVSGGGAQGAGGRSGMSDADLTCSDFLPAAPCPPRPQSLSVTTASNSWVIAPARSRSGAALHASDPHLSIDQAPGLWYLAGLHSGEGLNVVGVTYAGAPFVVMGHNDNIAYSFTVASVDLIDYFDDTPRSSIREEIRVKGEERPRVLEVRQGARGVMMDETTSLYWAGFDFEPATIVDSAARLQKAGSFDEFRRAVTGFGALDANWIYSDVAGNIGYQLGAPIPIRDYDTYTRQKANDPRAAWRGYRALEETPYAFDPAAGFLASCNNQVVPESWPYRIPGFYDPYRITRATAALEKLPAAVTADMRAMQADLASGLALRWKTLAANGARGAGLTPEARMLDQWDGRMSAGSREAALFSAWWRRLPRAVFEDELGEEWDTGRVLLDAALTTGSPVLDDRRTPRVETANDLSARAMREAREIAGGRTWGEACTLTIRHPLARVKILDVWLHLNRGPFPGSGDPGSLSANFYSYRHETQSFRTHVGPSMRFVLDWADVDGFSLSGVLGQSGNPFSPHYDDFLDVTTWNVPFVREKVFAGAQSVLRLTS